MQRKTGLSRRLRYSLGAALLAATFAPLPLAAQETSDEKLNFLGVVVDRVTGTPIVGAYVEIVERDAGTYTDAQGRFKFSRVRPGTYSLKVQQLGYTEGASTVRVEAGSGLVRVELQPDPVMLQAIEVVTNRLTRRRNSLAVSVRAYHANELATTASFSAFEFVRSRMTTVPCPSRSFATHCLWRRGSVVSPQVVVDEVPYFGGLDVLTSYDPRDLYLIEVLDAGRQVRVYTTWFAQRLAQGKVRLSPVYTY
jgi:hypothetical protein